MALGPVMVDVAGVELDAPERDLLAHPATGGVILFARNCVSPAQVLELTEAIHAVRSPRLLVAVDQEGGRVQRLRDGVHRLPAAARFGALHDRDARAAIRLAEANGQVLGAELRAVGVDFTFAPVLDVGSGRSAVIGDRAFHRDPEVVASLARAFVRGLESAGVAAVGKHFPGHGWVREDSHHALPVDERSLDTLRLADLVAFERMVHAGIPALMTAHVVYPAVDRQPCTYSATWLKRVLRRELGFTGAVFSDDLSMAGAGAGDVAERANAALDAGCDVVLVCNDPAAARAAAVGVGERRNPVRGARLAPMHGRGGRSIQALRDDEEFRALAASVQALEPTPELDLDDGESAV